MRVLALGLGISVSRVLSPIGGLIWRNWTTRWNSLNNTWNSYN